MEKGKGAGESNCSIKRSSGITQYTQNATVSIQRTEVLEQFGVLELPHPVIDIQGSVHSARIICLIYRPAGMKPPSVEKLPS